MNILILFLIALFISLSGIVNKQYARVDSEHPKFYLYTGFYSLVASFIFFLNVKEWNINTRLLIFSALFGIMYLVSSIFLLKSMKYGSLALTSLITSYSLLIPTIYGILILNEKLSYINILGIILLLISIYLTTIKKNECGIKITFKWIICVLLGFLTNGFCSVSLRQGQIKTQNPPLMMAIAMILVFLLCLALHFIKEKSSDKVTISSPVFYLAVITGLLSGALNLLTVFMNNKMSASIMFPAISAIQLVVLFLFSVFVFKEKLSKTQIIGFSLGTIAVIIINI